jgi:hypothetical protein
VTDVGAVTWGNGATGTTGQVTASNSLVGSSASDYVGKEFVPLTNGNYVVVSESWDCLASRGCSGTILDVGAATWANGTTGLSGFVSATNSLVGSTANDRVGSLGRTIALSNGHYVVGSRYWNQVGAATWGNGTTGITGQVSSSNSLVGTTNSDEVGGKIRALTNGHYVVASSLWDCQASLGCSGTVADVGAVTWGNGTTGVTGQVSTNNSLVGSSINDKIGVTFYALTNGNYVTGSYMWDCQASLGCAGSVTDAGAVTLGSGTSGITGFVSATNSLIGTSANDRVGFRVTPLKSGNYVVNSQYWNCQTSQGCAANDTINGAQTWASGTTGITGFVSTTNSIIGATGGDYIGNWVVDSPLSGLFVGSSSFWSSNSYSGAGIVYIISDSGPAYGIIPKTD